MPERVNVRKACQLLGVSKSTVTRLFKAGHLTGTKKTLALNAPLLIDLSSIHTYIERCRLQARR